MATLVNTCSVLLGGYTVSPEGGAVHQSILGVEVIQPLVQAFEILKYLKTHIEHEKKPTMCLLCPKHH